MKTPRNRVRFTRGDGTREANLAMKSSGSTMTWVVPSLYGVLSEYPMLHVARQGAPLRGEAGQEGGVVLRDDLVEQGLFGTVALVAPRRAGRRVIGVRYERGPARLHPRVSLT